MLVSQNIKDTIHQAFVNNSSFITDEFTITNTSFEDGKYECFYNIFPQPPQKYIFDDITDCAESITRIFMYHNPCAAPRRIQNSIE